MAVETLRETENGIAFSYYTQDDIEIVIDCCLKFAAGRSVYWTVIPLNERGKRDSLYEYYGYVSVKAADKPQQFGADDARELMTRWYKT